MKSTDERPSLVASQKTSNGGSRVDSGSRPEGESRGSRPERTPNGENTESQLGRMDGNVRVVDLKEFDPSSDILEKTKFITEGDQ